MSFGIPVRNGLAIGLLTSTTLSSSRGLSPAMSLDFLVPSLDSRITFSRGSNATLVDATGKITYAPANLLLQSQTFDNAAWTKSGGAVTANTTTAPDGTSTADVFIENTANSQHQVYQNANTTAGPAVFSIYAKLASGSRYLVVYPQGGTVGNAVFDLSNGTITYSSGAAYLGSSIMPVGNGWYRCAVSWTASALSSFLTCYLSNAPTNPAPSYLGDGTSGIFIWGAQLEPVTYQTTPSTYVATTASAYYGPRFDYDPVTLAPKGLLIEEARTNLVPYSSDFTNSSWVKSLSAMAGTFTAAPDGTNTGAKWREDSTNNQHAIYYATPTLTAAAYTETWYLKAAERTKVLVSLATAGLAYGASVIADLSAGTLSAVTNYGGHTGATATMSSASNGWYRVSITMTATAAVYYPALTMVTGTNTINYTGDGTSGIYIWGAQLELASFATSYIPTVASTVTRSADVAQMTGTNFSSWYNQPQGTLVADFTLDIGIASLSGRIAGLGDAFGTNRVVDLYSTTAWVSYNGTNTISSGVTATTSNTPVKIAAAYATGSYALSANGATAATDATALVNTATQLTIGRFPAGSNWLNGHIRQIAYYNTRLPNAQLQTLTAPSLATTLSLSFTNQAYTVGV